MDAEQLKQSNRQRVAQISKKTETVLQLADKLERLADQLEGSGLSAIAEKLETFNEKLSGMPEQIAQMQSVSDKKLNAWISQVNQALSSIELSPQFQVDAPNVEVTAPSVDLSPITNLVSGIEKSINSAVGSIKMPEQEDRTDELKEAMEEVRDAINGLIFPVAEHPLPFKDSNGKGVQVQLDGSGNLPISASISGADGAITDGVDTAIKATVKDLTNSNPVTVAITDGNGDQITSFGGGTQYTEGDTDATITGTAMMMEGAANALVAAQGTAADGLLVNLGANNDVTVTGTVTANAGTGTLAVSAASLPLPSGAATSANQTTVIGHLDGVEGLLTTIDADTGNLPTIKTNTDFGTVTGGGTETGALRVTVANNSTGVLSVDDNGSTLSVDDGGGSLTVDGTVGVSGTVTVGSHNVTNAGTFAVQVSSALPAGTNAIGKLAANAGVNIGEVSISGTVDTELPTAAALSDTTANPTTVMVGAAKMLWDGTQWVRERNNLGDGSGGGQIGQMGNMVYNGSTWDRVRGDTTGMDNHIVPKTSGGLSIFRSIDLDETEEDVKTSAGQLYGWYIYNAASSVRYVKLYNATAANVTVGTTTPVMTIPIPATSGANVEFTNGIPFSTAITAAATTGVADSDTGAPGANEVIVNLLYK